MRSPVNWALLGLVIEKPSYGYELAQRFEQVYGDVLPVSNMSHIYMALRALKRRALIEEVPEVAANESETGQRPRPDFRATSEGKRAYREYLVAQRGEDGQSTQLFARQLAMLSGEPDAALEVLRHYERASLETVQRQLPPGADPSVEGISALIERLGCEESRLTAQARLTWVKYARGQFAVLADGSLRRR